MYPLICIRAKSRSGRNHRIYDRAGRWSLHVVAERLINRRAGETGVTGIAEDHVHRPTSKQLFSNSTFKFLPTQSCII